MKMIDVLNRELKEGMSINTEKEMCSKWKATISYDGMQSTVDLPKVCTPGCEKEVCRKAIDTALSTMYVNVGNLAEAKRWLDGEFWKETSEDCYKRVNNDTWICNQIEEFVDELSKNRENVAKGVVSGTEDYYSFLRGVDYVLDIIKYYLYDDGESQ
jgi:hypothetical protein